MYLDHVAIVTNERAILREFFVNVVGLSHGHRPPFSVGGDWLYLNGRSVLHLIDAYPLPKSWSQEKSPNRIDHFALRVDDILRWENLLLKLDDAGVSYRRTGSILHKDEQIFVQLNPQLTVEFIRSVSPQN